MDILEFPNTAEWESWLERHHHDRTEAWLRIAKRHSRIPCLSIDEALEVALCFGWIDGKRKTYDEVSYLQRYSRRRPHSTWSARNVAKAEALIAAGRMRPAGFAEIEAAKRDGRWDAGVSRQGRVSPDR